MSDRDYDVVLFGATGFTGELVAEYLARKLAKGDGARVRWAIAGRNEEKLRAVRDRLTQIDAGLSSLPIEIADGHDAAALEALVPRARTVCTTVGPYAKHGVFLPAACARHGTHYCDITGEVPFIRKSIDENDGTAKKTGARIVHCCGFDSIPFDLGVHTLWADGAGRETLAWVKGFVTRAKGGFSGGTAASMIALMEQAEREPGLFRLLANPHALDPTVPETRRDERDAEADQRSVRFDRSVGRWTAPFIMAQVNTRVVRRSNALLGHAYGASFRYHEAMSFGAGPGGLATALAVTVGAGALFAGARFRPARGLLARHVFPKPGEGPSPEARAKGSFALLFVGETERGRRVTAHVEGYQDPGYAETAKMVAESALCLAKGDLTTEPGVSTPAAAMGMRLVERLRGAGMVFRAAIAAAKDAIR